MMDHAIVKITIRVNAGIGWDSANILAPSNSNIILKRIWAIIKAIAACASIEKLFVNFIVIQKPLNSASPYACIVGI